MLGDLQVTGVGHYFLRMAKANTVVDVLVVGGHPSAYLAAVKIKKIA